MDWNINRFEEITEYDPDRGFVRAKRAHFTVNGTKHTLKISMKDFNDGKTKSIVEAEVDKISLVLEGKSIKK